MYRAVNTGCRNAVWYLMILRWLTLIKGNSFPYYNLQYNRLKKINACLSCSSSSSIYCRYIHSSLIPSPSFALRVAYLFFCHITLWTYRILFFPSHLPLVLKPFIVPTLGFRFQTCEYRFFYLSQQLLPFLQICSFCSTVCDLTENPREIGAAASLRKHHLVIIWLCFVVFRFILRILPVMSPLTFFFWLYFRRVVLNEGISEHWQFRLKC